MTRRRFRCLAQLRKGAVGKLLSQKVDHMSSRSLQLPVFGCVVTKNLFISIQWPRLYSCQQKEWLSPISFLVRSVFDCMVQVSNLGFKFLMEGERFAADNFLFRLS
uniref:Uncharacterized protein n=1 Tax=Trichuris muris TaxID=70415 RepID=A0A5S6R1Z9_TRIMR